MSDDEDWICDHCGKRHIWWDDREQLDETDDIVEAIDLHIKWFESQADQPERFRENPYTRGYLSAYENLCDTMRPLVDALKQQRGVVLRCGRTTPTVSSLPSAQQAKTRGNEEIDE